jgi:hypothetical protein
MQLQLSLSKKTQFDPPVEFEIIEVVETEEVTSFTEIMPATHHHFKIKMSLSITALDSFKENGLK